MATAEQLLAAVKAGDAPAVARIVAADPELAGAVEDGIPAVRARALPPPAGRARGAARGPAAARRARPRRARLGRRPAPRRSRATRSWSRAARPTGSPRCTTPASSAARPPSPCCSRRAPTPNEPADNPTHVRPLHSAAAARDAEAARLLLEAGADPDAVAGRRLHRAARGRAARRRGDGRACCSATAPTRRCAPTRAPTRPASRARSESVAVLALLGVPSAAHAPLRRRRAPGSARASTPPSAGQLAHGGGRAARRRRGRAAPVVVARLAPGADGSRGPARARRRAAARGAASGARAHGLDGAGERRRAVAGGRHRGRPGRGVLRGRARRRAPRGRRSSAPGALPNTRSHVAALAGEVRAVQRAGSRARSAIASVKPSISSSQAASAGKPLVTMRTTHVPPAARLDASTPWRAAPARRVLRPRPRRPPRRSAAADPSRGTVASPPMPAPMS